MPMLNVSDELLRRITRYGNAHLDWHSLHVVMSDGNFDDDSVKRCLAFANTEKDQEGISLAQELLKLTESDRQSLFEICMS